MVQLWVNLPANRKMDPPRYQELRRDAIPTVSFPVETGTARIIAGDFGRTLGAARTATPVILWDVKLRKDAKVRIPIPSGVNAAVFVRSGSVWLSETHTIDSRQLAVLTREGNDAMTEAKADTEFLVVGGEPIEEPVVAYGPFVMNTTEEIRQAINDVRSGSFGRLD